MLLSAPATNERAFIVVVPTLVMVMGLLYNIALADALGSEPSVVYLIHAPGTVVMPIGGVLPVNVPPLGFSVGATTALATTQSWKHS